MKLKVEIEIGNDAMVTGDDLARAVHRVAESVANILDDGEPIKHSLLASSNVRDDNGNRVGSWSID